MSHCPRDRVFVEKVLKRLFPQDPHGQEKRARLPAASETPPEKERCRRVPPLAGGGTGPPPGRRLYTVALPPEGYVPVAAPAQPEPEPEPPPPPPSCTDSEGSSSSEGVADRDPHDQPKRRRIRKHKSKKKIRRPSSVHVEEAELEKQQSLLEERLQPRHADGPAISKNKKRKLKKKQQMKRKRAAGVPTKAAGISFLYAPGDGAGGLQRGGRRGRLRGRGPGGRGDKEDREDSVDAEQDGGKGSDDQAEGILDFLKSTQEMYFYDGVSKGSDPAFLAASEALLRGLGAGSVPPSDLRALGHMKALLLLRDPGGLRRALQVFEEHCTLPPDQARVVSAFFSYWLTHVLPEKTGSEPGGSSS
ncbi:PREDICTED: LOW QUALITY PROTEIN: glutamate-rich protein 1 [Myotis brandtii]|uniref:LOW QUALITY PROTEIN: glutamate-rich protein 1 n=1 Tax=Myotis brandtii TaxID=109478 RepID=UPI000704661B|nr:PREDICTED: LOW QUALITY PROTEIN: glutamate-rich protein 1 [Myotis brandtii]